MLPLLLLAMAGPVMEEPWPCNESFVVSQGNNGAVSHFGTEAYAWDFDLDLGDPILAAKSGTVVHIRKNSTIGGCSSTYGNDANYVVIDHGDGTAALYLHLAPFSSPLSNGDAVAQGDLVGRVGLTGWVCGDHLHFQVQTLCGSWYCQSVQAQFSGNGVPGYLASVPSSNCPSCGANLGGGTTTIESSDLACFDGLDPVWGDSSQGQGGHHFHALARNSTAGTGHWNFGVSQSGDYEVQAHVPTGDANATGASYVIVHADGTDAVSVNQDTQKGWQSLGVYPFTGGGQHVELSDNTGDDPGAGRRVAFDALRFTYVPAGGDGPGPGDSGDPSGGDTTSGGDGGSITSGPDSGPSSASADGGTGSADTGWATSPPSWDSSAGNDGAWNGETEGGNALPGWNGTNPGGGGCACRSDGGGVIPWWAVPMLLAPWSRRRRRAC